MNISSKNSATIPLQLNITYLFCAKKIISNFLKNEKNVRLFFFSDSNALLFG